MRSRRFAALAALAMVSAVGGFVPIEPEPRDDDRDDEEPDVERPIAREASHPIAQTFGARAERRRQARAAQRGAR